MRNKTMKIIDLLNKIANGEDVPAKLLYKYKNNDYYKEYYLIFDKIYNAYFTDDEDSCPIPALLRYNLSNLNDTVEIIEDTTAEKTYTAKEVSDMLQKKLDELFKELK